MAYPPPPRPGRPIGVLILAFLVILVGVILVLGSLLLIVAAVAVLATTGITWPLAVTFVIFILSLFLLLAGVGLWNLRPWAWWLAVIVLALTIASAVSRTGLAISSDWRDLLPLALPVLVLIYLVAVRHHFRSPTAYVAPQ